MELEKLKEELRRDEGLSLTPYKSRAGHWNCGYGHNLEADGWSMEKIVSLYEAGGITERDAEAWLEEDIDKAVFDVKTWLGDEVFDTMSDARQRALVNMSFNLRGRLFGFTRLRTALLRRDFEQSAREMVDSRWYHQVQERAMRLIEMMKEG